MSLKGELLRGMDLLHSTLPTAYLHCPGVYAYGFERPSAIQQRAIMPVIKG